MHGNTLSTLRKAEDWGNGRFTKQFGSVTQTLCISGTHCQGFS